jgi:hypothetical protein
VGAAYLFLALAFTFGLGAGAAAFFLGAAFFLVVAN